MNVDILERKRIVLSLLAIAAAGFLFALLQSPLMITPGHDREVFRYVGMLIRNGGMPYVDVFDHKPPLIYVISALTHSFGPFGLWSAELVFSLLSAFALFFHARREKWSFPIFYPIFFSALYWSPAFSTGGGMTRGFAASFVLVWLCLPSRQSVRLELLRGFLLGSGFLWQQEEIFGLIPFSLLLLSETPRGSIVRRFFYWMLGALMILVPMGLWLILHHGFQAFWAQAFGFNMTVYPQRIPFLQRPQFAFWVLAHSRFRWSLLCLAAASVWAWMHGSVRMKKLLLAAWIACVGQFMASVVLSSYLWNHYWLGALPYFVLALGMTGAMWPKAASSWAFAGLCVAIWGLSPVQASGQILKGIQNVLTHGRRWAYREPWEPLYGDLEISRGQRGQLFVFRYLPPLSLNTDFDIISPSPYVYTHFWAYSGWDPDGARFASILSDLDRFQTRWILDYSPADPIRPSLQKLWNAYLTGHYTPVRHAGTDAILYRRRNSF